MGNINPIRYRGYYYDTDIGLYYLQSRYYDAEVGRFLNVDETAYLGANGTVLGYNLFNYCENNPTSYTDQLGYFRVKTWIISTSLDVIFALLNHVMMLGYISLSTTIMILARTPFTRKLAINLVKNKVIPVFVRGFYNPFLTALRTVLKKIGIIANEFKKQFKKDLVLSLLNKYIDTRFLDLLFSLKTWRGIFGLVLDIGDGVWDGYITF